MSETSEQSYGMNARNMDWPISSFLKCKVFYKLNMSQSLPLKGNTFVPMPNLKWVIPGLTVEMSIVCIILLNFLLYKNSTVSKKCIEIAMFILNGPYIYFRNSELSYFFSLVSKNQFHYTLSE